ncbi:P4 alpha zinc-binding domain protein [Alkalidesulfovibrio alkalitolerans DSM 16529]|uniref:p4 alpha zinc-binding domain protein n=1 Tax=Alkalidesulfovibrio alkalitolerans DSM 16529 TaxID=1121439 RepID=S7SZY1_9BACT|nr:primase-helicase zinc-binding domain-containing protein [Alkalidesulfovibrio alkalitolerans]EPR30382.1 P4 alpha zinc-binding domain protein [Alkalidesulfovibrio alkalitolerans DSM 16529]
MNLLDMIPAGLKHVAGTSNGEWAGPCPFCGGRDRFRIWPDHPSGDAGGRFFCRGCGKAGDGIAFLRERDGLSYAQACTALRVEPRTRTGQAGHVPPVRRTWEPKPATVPPSTWQDRAARFAAECAAHLPPGSEGLAYATSRGLTAETVRRLTIGWNPADRFEDREAWGLPPEINPKTGKPRKVWLPAGMTLPSRRKSGLVALKVRRAAWTPEDERPKYVAVAGSAPGLALGSTGLPVVVVESELDAVLVWQEACDLAGTLALGTATGKPDADMTAYLRAAPLVLVALDFDDAGRAAWPWWAENLPQARPWPVPQGKDVGDLAGTPALVRAWIKAGLIETSRQDEAGDVFEAKPDTTPAPKEKTQPAPRLRPRSKWLCPDLCPCGSALFRVRRGGSNFCAACLREAA